MVAAAGTRGKRRADAKDAVAAILHADYLSHITCMTYRVHSKIVHRSRMAGMCDF